ncbi:bolA-like protein 1 isoform X3 [Acanthaster planci]|uniref:BolA-like protein 1 isoform X3 n=1 Tax=Acanthaster planci TaxID=133434 RepID=A0A8B7XI46_ACAPL|nr:bolA-like protein 1 isoform X3 [Acanthaster planci]
MKAVSRALNRSSFWRGAGLMQSVVFRPVTMATDRPVEANIRRKLTEMFQPVHLDVINESSMHNVPRGSETHFKVVVISERFDKESLIKRHRLVNEALKDELDGPVHALSIQAKTPAQWNQNASVSKSPPCLGGMAREQAQKDQAR